MGKTRYYVAASIDGFIADRDGGLRWLLQFGFEEFQAEYDAFLAEVGVVVMGSATYEFLLGEGGPWAYPEQVSWVLTSRPLPLPELPPVALQSGERQSGELQHGESQVGELQAGALRFARGDVSALHAQWLETAAGRDVWIVGGGHVAAQVADAGLIDEIVLTTMPVVLGAGTPLLPIAATSGVLAAAGTHVHPSGAITTTYAMPRR
ncbi:dihydrofolate reductase family protein [Herbiconiux sp. CPCC 205716]|uniref:Dihydrofolate reductase family protein n=1 Tax=Herbiconiux gentiana TaxID=2970912 RepID=A0ABT2GCC3_9MICO|nr:dihydrofolate reductase family protein [Herbiconiux gentiana]MCS5712965.1 dihydrofolate reductase family protein [Herbiconiux gentiana]